jgi:AraC-like DNA-binding protein
MCAAWNESLSGPVRRFGIIAKQAKQLPVQGHLCDRRLLLVMRIVEQNLQHELTIGELAEAVNLSAGRLAHLFTSQIGTSPQRYLNTKRMEQARLLLGNGVLSIKEIAAEVGIPNSSRFCRSFKAQYGITPKAYRQAHLRIDLIAARSAAASG